MNRLELALKSLPMFSKVPDNVIPIMLRDSIEMNFRAKEIIIGEGEFPSGLYILLDGMAKLYKSSPDGKEQTLFVLEKGEPFCLCSTFRKKSFPVTASALTHCKVISISKESFFAAAQMDNEFLFSILLKVSERLRDAMELAGTLSLQEVPQRIAIFLSRLQERNSAIDSHIVELPMTHKELAKIIGATPEALSRTIKKMNELGMISSTGRTVQILDKEKLELCAESGLQ